MSRNQRGSYDTRSEVRIPKECENTNAQFPKAGSEDRDDPTVSGAGSSCLLVILIPVIGILSLGYFVI